MKYFLIAGEASGDLHGAQLIKSLKDSDQEAEFAFLGGDLMSRAAGVDPIIHYRDMAYMGFVEVAKHLRTILGIMRTAKREIEAFRPDALILIDYPSFNLKMARHAKGLGIKVFYFISPKVWVWKEWRVKDIKRYVDRMLCILPFEPDFYRKHDYEATYVGNPTVNEIAQALGEMPSLDEFVRQHGLLPDKEIIALLPGSRTKEIRDNLPVMIEAARRHPDCQMAIAAAPGIDSDFYSQFLPSDVKVELIADCTWTLVRHARAALVTSGTATLETAILGTPQVACYRANGSKWLYKVYRRIIKGDYVTLPTLIAAKPVIPELLLHNCTTDNADRHLTALLADTPEREAQLNDYKLIKEVLTDCDCTATAAQRITADLQT